jgi:hypothetical protein
MDAKAWFGVSIFIWLLGFVPSFLGLTIGDETIQIPKWLSLVLLNRGQNISVPSLAFQFWGMLTALYAITLEKFILSKALGLAIGFILPLFIVSLIVDILRRK